MGVTLVEEYTVELKDNSSILLIIEGSLIREKSTKMSGFLLISNDKLILDSKLFKTELINGRLFLV